MLGGSSSTVQGLIEVKIEAQYKTKFGKKGGIPQIYVTLGNTDELGKKVVTLNKKFFDQPAAARHLVGFAKSFNMLSENEASSVFLEVTSEGIRALMNCDELELEAS